MKESNIFIDAVQACVNCYEGKHGDINFSIFKGVPTFFDIKNVQGYFVQYDDNSLMIVFTGSNETEDWKKNFDFHKVNPVFKDSAKIIPYGNEDTKIRVHRGFYHCYNTIRSLIHDVVERTEKEHIIITGHSLGAAIATLCAIDIQYNFENKHVICITAGSPRVGNSAFAKSFNKRIPHSYRFWLGEDPVTKVPLLLMGYRHCGSHTKQLGCIFAFWFKIIPIAFDDHRPERLLAEMKKTKKLIKV